MDNYDILNQYIDGELSREAEKDFFLRIAGDDNMHGRLRNISAMRSSIQSNSASMAPPVESTAAVFSALGFNPPASTSAPFPFLRSHWQKGAMSILTLIIIYLLFFGNANNIGISDGSDNISGPTVENTTQKSSIPMIDSRDNEESAQTEPEIRTVVKYVYVQVPVEKDDETNEYIPEIVNGKFKHTLLHTSSYPTGPEGLGFVNGPGYNDMFSGIDLPLDPIGLDIEFRGAQNVHFPGASVNPAETALFNNYALTTLYNVGAGFKVGLDLRNENFFQQYGGMDELGRYVSYEQQPNLTSLSLVIRYSYKYSEVLFPFAQIAGGGNKGGYLMRGMAGLEYAPYTNLGFVIGLEYSNFGFSYQGDNYYSNKMGLHYGVNLKL